MLRWSASAIVACFAALCLWSPAVAHDVSRTVQKYPSPQFATQLQDHFDKQNTNTWQQAYYVNATYWKGSASEAPVFLCVGGEGPALDGSAVVSSVHCNLAVEWLQETGALMFALEHRYYGCHNMSACPVKDFKNATSALRFLSSRQAVEDVAHFVTEMQSLYGLTDKNKWVTWGGSYPGMVAGWSRLKHPELIHASVASSAPVHAKLDMFEYNDAVSNAYTVSDNDVGGSPECRQAIADGHGKIKEMIATAEGMAEVEKLLGLSSGTLKSREAQIDFLGNGVASFPAQSNDPACTEPACNIKLICEIMTKASLGTPLQRLLALRKTQGVSGRQAPQTALLATRPTANDWADYWLYQTCTEFGFYQTCAEGTSCMWVQGLVDVESMADDCKQFGISIPEIEQSIEATNAHYGALEPSGPTGTTMGTCVLWPNGEVDPWSTLSVLKSPSDALPVTWVPGASHHTWTHPSAASDQASVVEARKTIKATVLKFLASDCAEDHFQPKDELIVV